MADEHHVALLRQGFKVWNLWRQSHPNVIPELKGADLTGLKLFKVDLSGADLSEVDFSETSLCKANLSGANLYKAILNTSILQEADFSGASLIAANLKDKKFFHTNLSGANLSRANLSGAKFYASTDLSNTNFSLTNLSEADLSGFNLKSKNFSGANLCRANLSAANLDTANFCRADLSGASLEFTNLRKAQIQGAIIDEKWYLVWEIINNGAKGRNLQGTDLSMADLKGANLSKADLRGANLSKTDINMASLRMANLREANLYEADLRGSDLTEADLTEANLKYAKLHRIQLQRAIIDEKWFLVWDIVNNGAQGRDLSGTDLSEANLSEAIFKNGNLSGADLSGSILSSSDLSWADLSGTSFRKANLVNANLDWADFSEADLSDVEGFNLAACRGAYFGGANFGEKNISSFSIHSSSPIRNKKEFFEHLSSWQNQEVFTGSIKKSLSSSKRSYIPGVLLYTDEDYELSLYVREHFDALDKLTGDWCTIYLIENPSPKWQKANQSWRKIIEAKLHENWFRSKPYDKSEAYAIARQLDVESNSLPCLVLISPTNFTEKLILPIREVSPGYFRELFSTIEKLAKSIEPDQMKQTEERSQVFDYLKRNYSEIVDSLGKHVTKEPTKKTDQLKTVILFLAANPLSTRQLRLDEEVREIEAGLQRSRYREQFSLKQQWAVRSRDLQRAMLDLRPQIVHFSGHGVNQATNADFAETIREITVVNDVTIAKEGLILEDSTGQPKAVSTDALARLFELFAGSVECVVLNACYSERQARAIAQHVPYVIGMNQAIGDQAAIEFSVGFYDALGAGESVEFAYKVGCATIQLAGISEHLTPKLIIQK